MVTILTLVITQKHFYQKRNYSKERLDLQDRIKAILKEIDVDLKGPPLILSRVQPSFLIELFKIEVPEIGQNLISIVGASRDPGLRAKIAVTSDDKELILLELA